MHKNTIGMLRKRFGRLYVFAFDSVRHNEAHWWCRCDCGAVKSVRGYKLRTGLLVSCGCIYIKHGHTTFRSGSTVEYTAWVAMKGRCYNVSNKRYEYYGGRGIKVCDRWLNSFEAFYKDVGPRPAKYMSLDRYPNNDGDYEPGNVRWATKAQQSANRRPATEWKRCKVG